MIELTNEKRSYKIKSENELLKLEGNVTTSGGKVEGLDGQLYLKATNLNIGSGRASQSQQIGEPTRPVTEMMNEARELVTKTSISVDVVSEYQDSAYSLMRDTIEEVQQRETTKA